MRAYRNKLKKNACELRYGVGTPLGVTLKIAAAIPEIAAATRKIAAEPRFFAKKVPRRGRSRSAAEKLSQFLFYFYGFPPFNVNYVTDHYPLTYNVKLRYKRIT